MSAATIKDLPDLVAATELATGGTPTESMVIGTISDGGIGPFLRVDLPPQTHLLVVLSGLLDNLKVAPTTEEITFIFIGVYTTQQLPPGALPALELLAQKSGYQVLDVYISNGQQVYNDVKTYDYQQVAASPVALSAKTLTQAPLGPLTPIPALTSGTLPAPVTGFDLLASREVGTSAQTRLMEAWAHLVAEEASEEDRAIIALTLDNEQTRSASWFMGAYATVGELGPNQVGADKMAGSGGITAKEAYKAVEVAQALLEEVGPLLPDPTPVLEFGIWGNWLGGFFSRAEACAKRLADKGKVPNPSNPLLGLALSDATPDYLGEWG